MHCDSVFSVSGYILTYLLTCVVPESGSDAGDAWRVQVLHYSDTVSASHNEWSPGRPGWYGQDGDHQGPRSRSWHYGLRLQLFGTDGLHGQQQFLPEFVTNFSHTVCFLSASLYFSKRGAYYGRPLSVSGRPCYILPMFFFYLFIFFLWPPYSPALVNGGSRKFYTWWTLSVIREVSSCIFSWSPLNYRVGQKVTKFSVFSDRTRKLSALTPERGRIL